MSVEKVRKGRGRPRDLEKREAILDAARALFQERGMAATTMEAVAARAAVSKMTVYGHFPDKPALLTAVFQRNIRAMRFPDLSERPDLASSCVALVEFGERLIAYLTRPEILKAGQLMAINSAEHPELAAAFYAAGPAAMVGKVAAFLASLAERRLLSLADPELGAEAMVVAWLGLSQLQQNLGLAGPPSAEAISKRVRFTTEALLRAWSPRPRGPSPSLQAGARILSTKASRR